MINIRRQCNVCRIVSLPEIGTDHDAEFLARQFKAAGICAFVKVIILVEKRCAVENTLVICRGDRAVLDDGG
jgi:hypothetical protein